MRKASEDLGRETPRVVHLSSLVASLYGTMAYHKLHLEVEEG